MAARTKGESDAEEPDERRFVEWMTSVPQVVIEPGAPFSADALASIAAGATWILVRTPSTYSGTAFAALVLVDPNASPAAELDAALSCANACFGVSASRFTTSLPPDARAGEAKGGDAALAKLAAASGHTMVAPSIDRVAFVLERGRSRAASAPWILQALREGVTFGSLTSRDPRTGERTMRTALSSSPLAAIEARGTARPLAEIDELADAAKASLDAIAREAARRLGRPVRVVFEVDSPNQRVRIVSIHPLRRSGLVAFGLAADLLSDGVPAEHALALITPADVSVAVPMRIEADPSATAIRGIAAGTGIAEGRVCLSQRDALALSRAGLSPILFVHDIEPDDIDALRASAGVVTVRGGLTGEAAVMARGLSKPCVASGAALSLASDHVGTIDGGSFRSGERVTIDGSSGLIVRGAHARTLGDLPASVAAVLSTLEQSAAKDRPSSPTRVVAAVDHPAHVVTAKTVGASDIAIARPEALFFDAAVRGEVAAAAIPSVVDAIFDAAKGSFDRLFTRAPSTSEVLPAPLGRALSAQEVADYLEAVRSSSARTDVAAIVDGPEAQAALAEACAPDSVLAMRVASA
ncbi:MAG: hypothetical protein HOW73_36485 [Polyangiaceae bacterium]|nr:hypothetical protein [Polyangiaceae bacterium]